MMHTVCADERETGTLNEQQVTFEAIRNQGTLSHHKVPATTNNLYSRAQSTY